jgi:hypothetical protein
MALIIIDRIANPELATLDSMHIAALMLRRAPLPSDLIVELIDPTANVEPVPAALKPIVPPVSPPKPIKRMRKNKL